MCKYQWKGIGIGCLVIVMTLFFHIDVYAAETAATYEFKGCGTQYDPYLIASYEDLCALRDMVDAGNPFGGVYFKQKEDIVFPDGEIWNPIGDLKAGIAFSGYYNGNGHTISNIYCEDQYAGVFSFLDGEVWNLGIESGSFKGDTIGSITSHGTENARVVNCYNKADILGIARAGGITDNFPGIILFCWNLGNVSGTSEQTLTAGICSFGSPYIMYCYDIGADKLVNDVTFTGSIIDSTIMVESDAGKNMEQMYGQMWNVYSDDGMLQGSDKNVPVKRGNITFMRWTDGNLIFDPEYEPDVFLKEKEENKQAFLSIFNTRFEFDGKGTEKEPFQIKSYEDLCRLRDCVDIGVSYRGYYFEQMEDITFPEGVNWAPIGELKKSMPFSGVYDGKGHVIANIYSEDQYAGLFSFLDGEVRNLGIESGEFQGATIGSITSHGTANASIINCYNKADVIGNDRAGGIADNFGGGAILFCWNLGNVSGTREDTLIGGISSYTAKSVEYCHSISGNNVICPLIFNGKQVGSSIIEEGKIADTIRNDYRYYVQYISDEIINSDQIVFPMAEGTSLKYDRTFIPDQIKKAVAGKMLPVYVLLCVAILFGVASLVGIRKGKNIRE